MIKKNNDDKKKLMIVKERSNVRVDWRINECMKTFQRNISNDSAVDQGMEVDFTPSQADVSLSGYHVEPSITVSLVMLN